MDVREKLIELLTDLYGCDPAYYDVDAWAIAQHLVDHAVASQKWISVDDKLPEEKVNCIVYYKHAYCDNDDYWAIGICFYDGEKFQIDLSYKVTHWMPIPKPPKGGLTMRLIDADALIKEACAEGAYGYVDAKQIADAPTIDAVPVVRCKDCRYFKTRLCENEDNHDDWFCADGERKDGDGNG